jgi:hypothetical protein
MKKKMRPYMYLQPNYFANNPTGKKQKQTNNSKETFLVSNKTEYSGSSFCCWLVQQIGRQITLLSKCYAVNDGRNFAPSVQDNFVLHYTVYIIMLLKRSTYYLFITNLLFKLFPRAIACWPPALTSLLQTPLGQEPSCSFQTCAKIHVNAPTIRISTV